MNQSLQRQVDGVGSDLMRVIEVMESLKEAAATRRLYNGERRWRDFQLVLRPWVDELRQEVMGWMPVWVVEPEKTFELESPLLALARLVAHVPDEPLPPASKALTDECESRWRSPDVDEAVLWAGVRTLLEPDVGMGLRRRCWRQVPQGWRLTDDVENAVAAVNRWPPRDALARLTCRKRVKDNATVRATVQPGHVLVWEEDPP